MHEYDFYHLAEYHRLDTSGEAFLLYFANETDAFAFPVIVRNIEGTEYKDITSVYGYAGPLSRKSHPAPEAIRLFQEELKKYLDDNRIISVFARLHPLFEDQSSLLQNRGEVSDTNLTVAIDLTLPEKEQRSQYVHSLKNDINRLHKKGLVIKKAETKEDIDTFIAIYRENMKRVHASAMYFFPDSYFYDFLDTLPATIFLAYYEGTAVSGCLFTACNGIIQTHLSATEDDYLALSPLKYVWDQIRIWGTKEQLQWVHLGGGYGGQNDALFAFKSQFSNRRFVFKVWKYIHHPEAYHRLVQKKYKGNLPDTAFFPLYRYE
ncbi:hypothetical protein FACS189423_11020 [Bacteroidia bacterium]|nr:hypothetical protein FACS189423_11020 [Bacteroidia bacterium]